MGKYWPQERLDEHMRRQVRREQEYLEYGRERERRRQEEERLRGPIMARLLKEIPLIRDGWSQAKAWHHWAQCTPLVSLYLGLIELALRAVVRLFGPLVSYPFQRLNERGSVTVYLNKLLDGLKRQVPCVLFPTAEICRDMKTIATFLLKRLLKMAANPAQPTLWVARRCLGLCVGCLQLLEGLPGALLMAGQLIGACALSPLIGLCFSAFVVCTVACCGAGLGLWAVCSGTEAMAREVARNVQDFYAGRPVAFLRRNRRPQRLVLRLHLNGNPVRMID